MLHDRPASDKDLLKALNITPLSWILIRHSLQVSLFITLGRIFDLDNKAFSVDDLLRYCVENIEIFSLDNLKQRKLELQKGKEPEWLPEYIQNAYCPVAGDFQRLRGEATNHRKVFDKIYKPIRHKLIAHTDKQYMDKADILWSETNIGELERIIWFLNDLKETLFQTYQNGEKPELQGRVPDIAYYKKDFGKLLDNIKKV
jgi:hypothetical protein